LFKINRFLQKLELLLGKILVCVILLVSALQILCRYILRKPLSWTQEVACYSLVWITFLSMSYLYSQWSHVSLTIIEAKLSERTKTILKVIFAALIAAAMLYLLPAGISCYKYMTLTPALKLPEQWFFTSVPTAYILITYHSICHIIEGIKKLKGKEAK
jgi:TRAP-type C4-dicarboxylate transport system permease small subunit